MCCSHGVIPRSDPRFSFLPAITPTRAYTHDPFLRFHISARTRTRFRPLRARASVNDRSVAAPPQGVEALSFYDLLGISETGTLLEIKHAYKQLARKYHPDVSPPGRVDEYTQRFIRVQEAYETLSDPGRRAMYDRDMARGLHLAFSARRRFQSDEQMEERSEWKARWQGQLSELKRRSMNNDGQGNMSWGARMRRQRNDASNEV
ncbi:chaperone protein dnaJ 20, chloroplastic-like [Actinidia eriantha]|uniref:chaperone protein dnaJ 20, chloroplastic-like n=1 Tax=Actinidia eriantha TaxID=165200 RepID=UPI00258FE862|nr:chaperone protein dnaJ 20, chloroplastic-like [Actinidia eriantha]